MRNVRSAPGANRGPHDSGSIAAEFALVLPVLIVLLFTIVNLASVYFDQLHLQATARDAARAGSIDISQACKVAETELAQNDVGTRLCRVLSDCQSGKVSIEISASKKYSIPILGD